MSKAPDVLQRALASAAAERKHRNSSTATAARIGDPDNRLWYCTPDRVNLAHAEQLAAPFGLTIEHHEPRDGQLRSANLSGFSFGRAAGRPDE